MIDVTTDPFRRRYEDDDSDWGGHSGAGSLPFWTIGYRAMLENFIAMNEIKSIVDLGCGDWQFSKFMNLEGSDITASMWWRAWSQEIEHFTRNQTSVSTCVQTTPRSCRRPIF